MAIWNVEWNSRIKSRKLSWRKLTRQPTGTRNGKGTRNVREDLEFLEVARQLEEAVVGVRHGKVDSDEPGGEGGGDPGAERGLPHREPLLLPHPLLLLFPPSKNPGNGRGEEERTRGMKSERRRRRAFFGSLSCLDSLSLPHSLPFLSPSFLLRLLFLVAEFNTWKEGGRAGERAGIEYSRSCFYFSLFLAAWTKTSISCCLLWRWCKDKHAFLPGFVGSAAPDFGQYDMVACSGLSCFAYF